MNRRQFIFLLVGTFLMVGMVSLLIRGSRQEQQKLTQQKESVTLVEVAPIDEGGGVFYFPVTGESYRRSLAAFYKSGKTRRCDFQGFTEGLVDPDTYNARTITTGFILHCRDNAIEAQSITVP